MQRAAASTRPITTESQTDSQAHVPHAEASPSKRRKIDADTPALGIEPTSELEHPFGKVDDLEAKRARAMESLAEAAGETKWVLSALGNGASGNGHGQKETGLRITSTGYSEIDAEAWNSPVLGRRSFGKFNKDIEVRLLHGSHIIRQNSWELMP